MRVNSGKYKEKWVEPPQYNDYIRPTTDKVKEALFGILQSDIEDAVVVDLFSGTGNLGIEALSRGAKKVYFCDAARDSINLIRKNVSFIDDNDYEIVRGDFKDCLTKLATRGIKVDIIICDPPYGKGLNIEALQAIEDSGILKKDGIVVIERGQDDVSARKNFSFISTREYGKIYLDIYRNCSKCAITGSFDPFTNGHKFLVEKALEKFDFVYIVNLINEEKTPRYTEKTRRRIIELSVKEYKHQVRIDFYKGFTYEYCLENGINTIVRGYRNDKDLAYEEDMAKYNKEHGNIETILIKAETDVSSTLVKEKIEKGEDVTNLVNEDIVGLLKKR